MRCKAVGVRARVFELAGIAHADQIRRHAAAEPGNLRHHIAPEIGGGRVAVEKEKHRLARAEFDIGHALAVHDGKFLWVRFDAVRHRHSSPLGR